MKTDLDFCFNLSWIYAVCGIYINVLNGMVMDFYSGFSSNALHNVSVEARSFQQHKPVYIFATQCKVIIVKWVFFCLKYEVKSRH